MQTDFAVRTMERVKTVLAGKATTDKVAEEYVKAIEDTMTALQEK
jgi:hypothetical protein